VVESPNVGSFLRLHFRTFSNFTETTGIGCAENKALFNPDCCLFMEGVLKKVYTGRLPNKCHVVRLPGSDSFTVFMPFRTEKVTLSYTFY